MWTSTVLLLLCGLAWPGLVIGLGEYADVDPNSYPITMLAKSAIHFWQKSDRCQVTHMLRAQEQLVSGTNYLIEFMGRCSGLPVSCKASIYKALPDRRNKSRVKGTTDIDCKF